MKFCCYSLKNLKAVVPAPAHENVQNSTIRPTPKQIPLKSKIVQNSSSSLLRLTRFSKPSENQRVKGKLQFPFRSSSRLSSHVPSTVEGNNQAEYLGVCISGSSIGMSKTIAGFCRFLTGGL
jgi:hypothetical protein